MTDEDRLFFEVWPAGPDGNQDCGAASRRFPEDPTEDDLGEHRIGWFVRLRHGPTNLVRFTGPVPGAMPDDSCVGDMSGTAYYHDADSAFIAWHQGHRMDGSTERFSDGPE